MNILFLSWAYPNGNKPYLGIWAHQQALALRSRGIEVEVVNTVPYIPRAAGFVSSKVRSYSMIPAAERLDGIQVYRPKFLRAKPNTWADKLLFRFQEAQSARIIRELAGKLDFPRYHVIHAHNLFPDGAIAYQLHQRYGIPYILTIHDVDRFNSVASRGESRTLAGKILQHASKVLAVSSRVKDNLQPHVTGGRLGILYNTFWTQGKKGSGRQQNQIVFIASLIPRKGIYELLRAFHTVTQYHPEWELIVIGDGVESEGARAAADELQIRGQVTFTGKLSHAEAMEKLSAAAIFCLPSWMEAFGVVYAEAMSYGVPIVGCSGEGIADVVTDGENGILVEPRDVTALAGALLYLIEHPAEAAEIGRRGQDSIRELHPDRFGMKLEGIYRAVIGGA